MSKKRQNSKTASKQAPYFGIGALFLSLAFLILALSMTTLAKYVTEIESNPDGYNVYTPYEIKDQITFYNAIKSGYEYIKLSDELTEPLMMTGDSATLINNLTLDLNGNEIQRNSDESLLKITDGIRLTVIDTIGGGGLYNPIGDVLQVTSGGELNVRGGILESGPRPVEYFSKISTSLDKIDATVLRVHGAAVTENVTHSLPRFKERVAPDGKFVRNIYFDVEYSDGNNYFSIPADTYCYATVLGEDSDVTIFDMDKAEFVYRYTSPDGKDAGKDVLVFGYLDDIEISLTKSYSAVQMDGGTLAVNVEQRANQGGSFYSYFGTPLSSCVHLQSGTMTVDTYGEFSTVNPDDIPAYGLAKKSEGSCVLSDGAGDGILNITHLASATSYNGSIIAMWGGRIEIDNAVFEKNATLSHSENPQSTDSSLVLPTASASDSGERLQYCDAAVFVTGGSLGINGATIVVNKNIAITEDKRNTYGVLMRGVDPAAGEELVKSSLNVRSGRFILHGYHSYGIYATRGTISMTGGGVYLDNDYRTYGVYAVNKTNKDIVNITLTDSAISIPQKILDKNGNILTEGYDDTMHPHYHTYVGTETAAGDKYTDPRPASEQGTAKNASAGVYLNSAQSESQGTYGGGTVTLDNTTIRSQELGIAVNGSGEVGKADSDSGKITFKNGGEISAYNASAVVLNGGAIDFENGVETEYNIVCEINRQGNGVSKNADGTDSACSCSDDDATKAGTHLYELYLPWDTVGAGSRLETYANENAIRVLNGSFTSYGNLVIKFRGLYNDYDLYDITDADPVAFDNIVIKSFAVVCDGGNINIYRANILNTVGGGVKVQGGTIVLGDPDKTEAENNANISVETKGAVHGTALHAIAKNYPVSNAGYNAWHYYANLAGGHAVVARSGNITVHGGNFTANYGNGVAATGDGSVITINGGNFIGNMVHISSHGVYTQQGGPATHYGLKVMGASTVNINGGYFDGKNGGFMVRGESSSSKAVVNIAEAEFGRTGGQDGVNVFDYSDVYFGTYSEEKLKAIAADENDGRSPQDLIKVTGRLFPIAVNPILTQTYANVYIYYGTYITEDNRCIGSLDDTLQYVNMFIYGFGSNVYNAGNYKNHAYVRFGVSQINLHVRKGADTEKRYYPYVTQPTNNPPTSYYEQSPNQ